ncbi:MAG: aminopeptidase [Bacteroidia bacterium]|nr:aminopeptidase [Bacteroidia bacterium]
MNWKRILKRILLALLLVITALVVIYWDLVVYGIKQAKGQLTIVWQARPIEEFLDDPAFPDSLKEKLRLISEIRQYAIDSLGLEDTRNYKTLYDQKGEEIMWVVTASEPFRLRAKEWHFPVLGAVPYKGFFNRDEAVALKDQLAAEGWDVSLRNPGGWSTLGWFTDPILSKMLGRDEGDLASLIIHEMSHATIFVKDSVNFNENLASFIGDRGAEQFLIHHYGEDSKEYNTFVNDDRDYVTYVNHILRGTRYLDSLYNTMQAADPPTVKQRLKSEAIRKIVDNMDTLTLTPGKRPSLRFKDNLPNNAYFMSFIHYQSQQDVLMDEWHQNFGGDLRQYILFLANKYPFL